MKIMDTSHTVNSFKCLHCRESHPYDDAEVTWTFIMGERTKPKNSVQEFEIDGIEKNFYMCLKCFNDLGDKDATKMAIDAFRFDWIPFEDDDDE